MMANKQNLSIRKQTGQTVLGLVILVGLIGFILTQNIQTQQNVTLKKIVESKLKSELELSIDQIGQRLYEAYIQSSLIPEAAEPGLRRRNATTTDPTTLVDFHINGNQICSNRSIYGMNYPICITLPNDFAMNLKILNKPDFFIHPREILGLNYAQAQAFNNRYAAPTPDASISLSVVRNFNSYFTTNYTSQNCLAPSANFFCVTVRICLKAQRSQCASADDSDRVIQTFILTRAPQTQQRN